jgi:NADPH2:quinone reductase
MPEPAGPAISPSRSQKSWEAGIVQKGIQWLSEGEIEVHVSEVFPLEQVAKAHQLLEAGSMTGKIVLEINM